MNAKDLARLRISDPYNKGAEAIIRLRLELAKAGPVGETKADRAYRQLETIFNFRRDWRSEKWGEIDHVVVILNLSGKMRFGYDPKSNLRSLFIKLVLHSDRRRADLWGRVLHAMEFTGYTIEEVRKQGMKAIGSATPVPRNRKPVAPT